MGQQDKIEGNVAIFDRNSPLRGLMRAPAHPNGFSHIVWKSPIA